MSLSERERRILAEIEHALLADDPELAKRVAKINRVGAHGRPGTRMRGWVTGHIWLIVLVTALVAVLLVVAVLVA
ncbi:DUF3040 domain-containing protein [Nonomuraea sp. NPDC048916]|uniref:DUF3040 domain-containing protein n=1 Tax=Nonomuraea sp. NPDC048916 TaxID=3154232 RepID=UPI0033C66655